MHMHEGGRVGHTINDAWEALDPPHNPSKATPEGARSGRGFRAQRLDSRLAHLYPNETRQASSVHSVQYDILPSMGQEAWTTFGSRLGEGEAPSLQTAQST
jgi:hypothetical protein